MEKIQSYFSDIDTERFTDVEGALTLLNDPRFIYNSRLAEAKDFTLNGDYSLTFDGENHSSTMDAFDGYMKKIGIPNVFAKRIPISLLQENQMRLRNEFNKPLTVITRQSDNAIVGVESPTYKPVQSLELIHRLSNDGIINVNPKAYNFISTNEIVAYDGANVSDIQPEVGDIINIGRRLSNSNNGFGSLTAALATFRLVCSNGAVVGHEFGRIVRKHNGDLSMDEIMENFIGAYSMFLPNTSVISRVFSIMKNSNIPADEFINSLTNSGKIIANALQMDKPTVSDHGGYAMLTANNIKYPVEKLEELEQEESDRKKHNKSIFAEHKDSRKVEDVTYYDMFNHITALPHEFKNFPRAIRKFEEYGGNMLSQIIRKFSTELKTDLEIDTPEEVVYTD